MGPDRFLQRLIVLFCFCELGRNTNIWQNDLLQLLKFDVCIHTVWSYDNKETLTGLVHAVYQGSATLFCLRTRIFYTDMLWCLLWNKSPWIGQVVGPPVNDHCSILSKYQSLTLLHACTALFPFCCLRKYIDWCQISIQLKFKWMFLL